MSRWRRHLRDDRGLTGIAATMMIVIVLAGGGLIVDGGRALVAKREIINLAEAAARAGASTADRDALDADRARQAALDHITAHGVDGSDIVAITISPDRVTVTLRAHRAGVFTSLLGNETISVTATGTAAINYG